MNDEIIVELGGLVLRTHSGQAYWKGEELPLTFSEFKMVELLIRTPGQNVTYRHLYDLVHGVNFQSGRGTDGWKANARTFIKRIRRKFWTVDPQFDCIKNYAGFGYRWEIPTKEADSAGTQAA